MSCVCAVISVTGEDQKGVVARFATYLAERGVNLLDLQQHVVRGLFLMDMLVDLAEISVSLDELMASLRAVGASIGMEVRVTRRDTVHGPARFSLLAGGGGRA